MRYISLVVAIGLALVAYAADARAAEADKSVELTSDEIIVANGQSRTFVFESSESVEGLVPLLTVEARMDAKELSGMTRAMQVTLNGTTLFYERVLDRPRTIQLQGGAKLDAIYASFWVLACSPDYEAIHKNVDSPYYIAPGAFDAYRFTFDLKGLVRPAGNELVINCQTVPKVKLPLAFRNARVEWVTQEQAKARTTRP